VTATSSSNAAGGSLVDNNMHEHKMILLYYCQGNYV